MEERERITGMLHSVDPSMVLLGTIAALSIGPEWCIDTFKHINMNAEANEKGKWYYPVIATPKTLRGKVYIKSGVAVSFADNYIKCDYTYRMPKMIKAIGYTVINLDEDEEK